MRHGTERPKLEVIARVLGTTLGEAKSLGFKKRALLELDEAELQVWAVCGRGACLVNMCYLGLKGTIGSGSSGSSRRGSSRSGGSCLAPKRPQRAIAHRGGVA